MNHRALDRSSFALACVLPGLLAAACASQPPPASPQRQQFANAVSPGPRLEPKQPLPGAVKELLRRRMVDHTRDMSNLVSAIMVLDYPSIHTRAEAVAADANLSRPIAGDATELNSSLPERFFLYQDELRANARLLASAAERLDAQAVADAYGRVAESCVRCHASYRAGRGHREDSPPPAAGGP